MANIKRLTIDWSETGLTVYAIVRRETDDFRLDDADGSFAVSPADPYLSLTEDTVIKGRYEVDENRQAWNDGQYGLAIYKQTGGSPAPASDTIIGSGEIIIKDDMELTLATLNDLSASDVAAVVGIAKNTLLNNFEFFMTDATDHVTGKTGLTITAERSLDGAAFAACANSVSEVSDGAYKIDFANTDLNGDIVTFKFSATGADTRFVTIKTSS